MLYVNVRPAAKMVWEVRRRAELHRIVVPDRQPVILDFRDVATERRNVYTPGGIARIHGGRLDFDAEAADEGVFFIAEDGVERRAEVYALRTRRQLVFLVPASLRGPQWVEVRSRCGTAWLRKGRYEESLVQAVP